MRLQPPRGRPRYNPVLNLPKTQSSTNQFTYKNAYTLNWWPLWRAPGAIPRRTSRMINHSVLGSGMPATRRRTVASGLPCPTALRGRHASSSIANRNDFCPLPSKILGADSPRLSQPRAAKPYRIKFISTIIGMGRGFSVDNSYKSRLFSVKGQIDGRRFSAPVPLIQRG
jgi:hypothetical protein